MEAAQAVGGLSARLRARGYERELERLRPLGEAYVMRRFGGALGHADAEDAVAEVVIRLHRRIAEGRAPDNLRAAFFTSCRNAAIDQMRFRGSRPTVALEAAAEMAASAPPPLEWAEGREDGQRLREALGRMRPNYREAILLRFGLGLTVPEIAARLGISLPAAKKLVLRSTAQVRKRLASIEGQEFCPEMQELARRSLFEKEAAGLASEAEAEVLHAHFAHCGSCRSFLSTLHDHLHSLGGAALVGGWASHAGAVHHLAAVADRVVHVGHLGVEKARLVAFRAGGVLQSDGAGTASALGSTSQKVAAVCTVGAASAATCLAAGVVGPGFGLGVPHAARHHQEPAKQVSKVLRLEEPAPVPEVVEVPAPEAEAPQAVPDEAEQEAAPAPQPEPAPETPAEQSEAEFGIESAPSPEATSSAPPRAPAPPPATSSESSGGGGGGSSGGGSSSGSPGGGSESFGFSG